LIVLTSANFDFSHAQANGDDIRVWDATAAALVPHWIEAWDANAQTARIWFKTTDITNEHWLYFGNGSATDASDGDEVFLFFDDFGTRRVNEGTWETLTDFPIAIGQGAAAVLGDYLYAGAGGIAGALTPNFYRYDLTQGLGGVWEELADIPAPNEAATGVESPTLDAVSGKLYFMGGQDGGVQYTNCYEYDPDLDTWTTKADMPQAREDMGSAVISNQIYLFGGRLPDFIAPVDFYTPASNTWDSTTATNWPAPRQLGNFACAYNDIAYCISGSNSMVGYSNVTNPQLRCDSYTPATDTWAQIADIPFGVNYKEVNEVNANLYVIGGTREDASSACPYLQIYDVAGNSWVYGTARLIAQNCTGVHNGKIYTVSGNTGVLLVPKVARFTPNASFAPTSAAASLDAAKWTLDTKGSGGVNTQLNNSSTSLLPTNLTNSSVTLISVPTFTNGVVIEFSRICGSNYSHFGLGAGVMVDGAGGTTNWFSNMKRDGYAVYHQGIQQTAANMAFLYEVPTAGAPAAIGAGIAGPLDDGGRHRMSLSYSAAGAIVVKRNDTQWFSASDSTFLSTAKNFWITQGKFTNGAGQQQVIDWVFARTLAATEPSISLGAEEAAPASGGSSSHSRMMRLLRP